MCIYVLCIDIYILYVISFGTYPVVIRVLYDMTWLGVIMHGFYVICVFVYLDGFILNYIVIA